MSRLSIVMVSLDQRRFLGRAVESVLGQKGDSDVELIVVDGGSTDGSVALLESYGEIDRVVVGRDSGPADALNIGFSLASGDVFGYINSDDEMLPGAARRILELFAANDVEVVHGHVTVIDGCGRTIGVHRSPKKPSVRAYLARGEAMPQQGIYFSRASFERVGGFNVDNGISWDGELFLEFLQNGERRLYVDEYLGCFRLHGGGITQSESMMTRQRAERDRMFVAHYGRSPSRADLAFGQLLRARRILSSPATARDKLVATVSDRMTRRLWRAT